MILCVLLAAISAIQVSGRLDGKRTSFSSLAKVALPEAANNVRGESSDLVSEDGTAVIPGSSVKIAPLTAGANEVKLLVVTVSDVVLAGKYKGQVSWGAAGDHAAELTLTVAPKIALKAQDSASFQIVSCSWLCGLYDVLLPARLRRADRRMGLTNETPGEVSLKIRSSVFAEGAGLEVVGDRAVIQVEEKLAAGTDGPIQLHFERQQLTADRYRGTVRVQPEGGDAVAVGFVVDVRDSPLFPFLVILSGIALGRLAQRVYSPQTQSQLRLLDRFYRLQRKAAQITDAARATQVLILLAALKERIADPRSTEAELTQALDGLEQQLGAISPAAANMPAPVPAPESPGLWKRLVSFSAGTPLQTLEREYWYARPLLALLLLVLLTLVGMQTLYLGPGATFGAGGLFDYLPLLLWGLSADVAQRTLQNLKLT